MSSRGRNFRRRGSEDSAAAEEDKSGPSSAKPISKPTSTAATSASKPKPKKPPKLLSFADDEEEEEKDGDANRTQLIKNPSRPSSRTPSSFSRPSKPSSHKMTSLKDRVFHSSSSSSSSSKISIPSNVQPQAGSYTKEALLELQKNTRTLSSAAPAKPQPPKEAVIVLRGLVKPPLLGPTREEEEEESPESGDGDDGAAMPDEKMIAAIKAKREQMRQLRAAAPDFIAIDGGSHHGEAEGLSDEEPENLTRIALIGDKDGEGGLRRGVFEGAEVAVLKEEDDEEDEEERIWEEEQFRKGLGKNRVDNGVAVAKREAHSHSHPPPPPPRPVIAGQGSGLGMVTMSQQGEIAKKALLDNMKRLKESYGKTMTLLNKTDENLSASLLNITALEKSLAAADDKYRFMQKLRHFVSIICNFLQHKAPFIEELEDQMQQLHEKRASAIVERRTADNGDEMKEVEVEVNAAMSVLGRSSGDIAAAKWASEAALTALKKQANLPAMLDELGRDMNLQKRMAMKRIVNARNRRRARFDMKRLSSMDVDGLDQRVEGESSTDESDSESRAYASHRDLLLETAAHIFSDASEEFSQLSVVKETLEEWKRDYLSAYNDAYMSLSIPSIFSPYVRLELLKWDPLHEKTDFMKMNWYMLLMDYGAPEDGTGFAPEDADENIVPELVEKVAVPILHHEVVHCWDILSTRESKNVADATSLVTDYVPANSKALADLLLAIRTRLADAVANLTVPAWTPIVLQAVPNAARVAAYRFGTSVRLMRNICLWKDILALPLLEKLALDDLLCGKLLPHVRSITPNVHDAITRTERIIASLYGVWAGPSASGARRPKLQPLVDYVMLLCKMLEKKKSLAGATESEASRLARRLKKMLVDLNEYDKAHDIVRTFHLKEAL